MMFVLILCCGDRRAASTNDLYFSFITSNSGGFASGGSVPAIDIALQQIAMNGSILPDYSLNYTLQDSEVCNVIIKHLRATIKDDAQGPSSTY